MNFVKVKALLKKIFFIGAFAASALVYAEPVTVVLKPEVETVQAGAPFWVAVDFTLEKGWHAYWKNPGDAGMPPQIDWTLPEGFTVTKVEWPAPEKFSIGPLEAYGYSDHVTLLAEITPPNALTLSDFEAKAEVRWVVCNDETCLPGDAEQSLRLKVGEAASLKEGEYFKKARAKIPESHPPLALEKKSGGHEAVIKWAGSESAPLEKAEFFAAKGKAAVSASLHPSEAGHLVLSFSGNTPPESGVLALGERNVNLEFFGTEVAMADSPLPPIEAEAELELNSIWIALIFAFMGGILLNLMPCVLPVLAIKVLDFVRLAGQERWKTFKHGLYFALGVLVSFWVLAGLLLALQSVGESVGWGFQLQEPAFVAALAILMVFFAMSLFGVFEMGVIFASWAGQKEASQKGNKSEGSSAAAAFFSGVLATAVATPCTGPFLGSAIGYAVTLPPLSALSVFTSLGLGMALPYLLLTAFPRLLKFIPRPGKWMETFRQGMGFMMLMAALWLTWVFSGQTQEPATLLLLGVFIAVGLMSWILGKWATPFSSFKARAISWSLVLILAVGSFKAVDMASSFGRSISSDLIAEGDWEPFSPGRLAELKAKGVPVFVDFTAKWCLTCQFNHLALSTTPVEAKFKDKGVVRMKADWTQRSPEITAEMKKFGRNSVPLYVLYDQEESKILPQTLTPEIVMSTLEEAVKSHAH
jgi:thiol:disulfide interchange protein DsbD